MTARASHPSRQIVSRSQRKQRKSWLCLQGNLSCLSVCLTLLPTGGPVVLASCVALKTKEAYAEGHWRARAQTGGVDRRGVQQRERGRVGVGEDMERRWCGVVEGVWALGGKVVVALQQQNKKKKTFIVLSRSLKNFFYANMYKGPEEARRAFASFALARTGPEQGGRVVPRMDAARLLRARGAVVFRWTAQRSKQQKRSAPLRTALRNCCYFRHMFCFKNRKVAGWKPARSADLAATQEATEPPSNATA